MHREEPRPLGLGSLLLSPEAVVVAVPVAGVVVESGAAFVSWSSGQD